MTVDVKPLPERDYQKPCPKSKKIATPQIKETVILPKAQPLKNNRGGTGLDKRSDNRLRRGQIHIEARLDLHGMRQGEAHHALQSFILRTYEQEKRCILIITGKGRTGKNTGSWLDNEPGILRRKTPEWLNQEPLKPLILKTHPAQPKDGGDGALYVLLRRKR